MQATTISTEITFRSKRERSRIRRAALAGIIGPLLFTTVFLAQQAFRRAEYDPIAEPVSALEAGPNGWVQQINFLVFAALLLLFAIGLHRGIDRTRYGILGPAFLGVASIGLVLAAAYPLREDAAGVTYDTGGHFVAGITFFLSTALSMFVLSRRLAKDPHFGVLATYTAVCGVLALLGFVVAGRFAIPDDAPLHDWAGLLQRIVILAVTFPCLVALGIRLLSKTRD
jgi:hypothetical membrane protein